MALVCPDDSYTVIVHRNDVATGKFRSLRLDDAIGNRAGRAAHITPCTGGMTEVTVGQCQRRRMHWSRGYKSIDPARVHFGLGKDADVCLIELRRDDGEVG